METKRALWDLGAEGNMGKGMVKWTAERYSADQVGRTNLKTGRLQAAIRNTRANYSKKRETVEQALSWGFTLPTQIRRSAVMYIAGYTYERLFGYLNALGERVSIEVSEAKTKKDARLELEMTD